jgi:hypothetical protein
VWVSARFIAQILAHLVVSKALPSLQSAQGEKSGLRLLIWMPKVIFLDALKAVAESV